MADNSHQISGVAERYASSLYELAAEAKSVDAVAKDLNQFQAMIDSSPDLQRLVTSPVFSAEDQSRSIVALINKAGISGLVGNFLKVVARNRRLFAVPAIIQSFHEAVARERGEVTADVKTAHALSAAQEKLDHSRISISDPRPALKSATPPRHQMHVQRQSDASRQIGNPPRTLTMQSLPAIAPASGRADVRSPAQSADPSLASRRAISRSRFMI